MRWQNQMGLALAAAAEVSKKHGDSELGLTLSALKAGLLHRGRTSMVGMGAGAVNPPRVVLCGAADYSYRMGHFKQRCDVAGYRAAQSLPGYEILLREEGRSSP